MVKAKRRYKAIGENEKFVKTGGRQRGVKPCKVGARRRHFDASWCKFGAKRQKREFCMASK